MSLKLHEVVSIRYSKGNGDVTERHVIPTSVPSNIKAIDVTELFEVQRKELADFYAEYAAYLEQHMKQAFSFEDWLAQTKDCTYTPKWRTFKPAGTQVLEESVD